MSYPTHTPTPTPPSLLAPGRGRPGVSFTTMDHTTHVAITLAAADYGDLCNLMRWVSVYPYPMQTPAPVACSLDCAFCVAGGAHLDEQRGDVPLLTWVHDSLCPVGRVRHLALALGAAPTPEQAERERRALAEAILDRPQFDPPADLLASSLGGDRLAVPVEATADRDHGDTRDRGQGLLEYALVILFIVLVVVAAAVIFGSRLAAFYQLLSGKL